MGPVGSGTQFIINSRLFFLPPTPVVSAIVLFTEITAVLVASFVQTHLVTLSFPFLYIPYNGTLLPTTFTTSCILFPFLHHFSVSPLTSFTVPLSLPQLLQFLNTQSSKSLGEGLIPCLPKQPVIESATLTAPVLSREKSQRSLRWI